MQSACSMRLAGMEDTAELLEKKLASEISKMSLEEALTLAPVFSHYLNLMGIAEVHHRVCRPKNVNLVMIFLISFCSVVFPQTSFTILFASRLEVEIVLTAHPTQINRGTLQYKHIRLSHLLNLRDRPDLTSEDRDMVIEDLVREITSVWQTDELRHHKPTPVDEAGAGLNIVEQSLWKAVPHYLCHVNNALKKICLQIRFYTLGNWKTTSIEMHTNQVWLLDGGWSRWKSQCHSKLSKGHKRCLAFI
ncbi:putative phosphoenolpyruvate carboxylase [Rosa chinensis]|uniref:Putative phosphoenolpyruvate carboxylase n=1 Tax=Rosa chinensis TaxID=74649 RepID=A0A2P6RW57_ROSCH|nr:putative phosphoenolpyruvate carboxylase [Rosa chinensis]